MDKLYGPLSTDVFHRAMPFADHLTRCVACLLSNLFLPFLGGPRGQGGLHAVEFLLRERQAHRDHVEPRFGTSRYVMLSCQE